MAKFISNIIAFIIILVSLFLFSMSAIMLIVTDWNRWSESVPLFGILFAILCAATACWSLVLVPHFAVPFRIVPDFITKWMEENNKVDCPPVHMGYESVYQNTQEEITLHSGGEEWAYERCPSCKREAQIHAGYGTCMSCVYGCE